LDRFDIRADLEIAVGVGTEVELALEETPTSGYVWKAVGDDAGLAVVDAGFARSGASVGAGGSHVFRVRGVSQGRHVLQLRLARAWEPSPLRQHLVTLVVR
jgi:predicted secreted protein